MSRASIAIVGGGISGLAAAFDLTRRGHPVTVFESTNRWGGKIHSSAVGDRMVDAGPDSFLARVEPGYKLCVDLGIADQLTSPVAPVPAYLQRDGRLHELPQGTFLGVPTDLELFSRCTLISTEGKARVAQDLTLAATPIDGDISVGQYCRARLGDEVTDWLIDPLIGGINASNIDQLSLRSGAPQLWAAAQAGPSLIEGLRSMADRLGATLGSKSSWPVFYGFPGGIATITDELVAQLIGADLRLNAEVNSLEELDGFDHLILATPAPVTSKLLSTQVPDAGKVLAEIEYASVAQLTIEVPMSAIEPLLDASGVLFPRIEGTVLTACTWFSTKWAHYRRSDTVLLRLTSGRFGDTRAIELGDAALTTKLLTDLSGVFNLSERPVAKRIHRWIDALPQYEPGHHERVALIRSAVTSTKPSVQLVGAAFDGIGIPACIQSGRDAAARIIQ